MKTATRRHYSIQQLCDEIIMMENKPSVTDKTISKISDIFQPSPVINHTQCSGAKYQ
jgi:ABC-type uncharacterized transport system ATPase subunit